MICISFLFTFCTASQLFWKRGCRKSQFNGSETRNSHSESIQKLSSSCNLLISFLSSKKRELSSSCNFMTLLQHSGAWGAEVRTKNINDWTPLTESSSEVFHCVHFLSHGNKYKFPKAAFSVNSCADWPANANGFLNRYLCNDLFFFGLLLPFNSQL